MADTDSLVAALAKAQSEFGPIVKTHTNPAFKGSQYADIADVLAIVRPVLAANGIAVTQQTEVFTDGRTDLVTALMFGEERLESRCLLPIEGLDAQKVGSWLTYMRRYQICAILGVHPVGDDDDGNQAQAAPQARVEPAESERLAAYRTTCQERIAGLSDSEKETVAMWIRNHKVPSLKKPGATTEQLEELLAFIDGLGTEPFLEEGPANPASVVRRDLAGTERHQLDSAAKA